MAGLAVFRLFEVDGLGEAEPEIELRGGKREMLDGGVGAADGVFAEECGAIAVAAEDGGVCLGELLFGERSFEVADVVAHHVLAGEDAGAGAAADGGGDEVIAEADSGGGEAIDVRSLNDGIAVAAEVIEALIVCLDEENVGALGLCGKRERRDCGGAQESAPGGGHEGHSIKGDVVEQLMPLDSGG